MSVSRETSERLAEYARMLERWNSRINLVSPGDMAQLEQRHIVDCLQLTDLAPRHAAVWADLGSGGGLPGLVVAIARADEDTRFILVESDARKAVFLRQAARALDLAHVTVLARRIESVAPLKADVVTARALAPLPRLMPYLHRHLSDGGVAFLPKGRQWPAEVADAKRDWRFDCRAHPSITQDGAAVLELGGISHGAA